LTDTIRPEELDIARRVSSRVSRRWTLVSDTDVLGHLYLWLFENTAKVRAWRAKGDYLGAVYVTLKREAAKFCAAETAAIAGRPIDTPRFYSEAMIRRALPYIFEETPVTEVRENPTTGQALFEPAENSLALAIMTDIRSEYEGLSKSIRTVIQYRFRDGLTYEEIAELLGLTKEAARKSVARAVKRLSDSLA
jgi:RNA polymerase sigma factor (sigma-70 family)